MEEKIVHLSREKQGASGASGTEPANENMENMDMREGMDMHEGLESESPEKHEAQACIICGERKLKGISIVSEFICEDCEAEMVHTDVKDDKYDFFIHQMKQIWVQLNA